MLQTRWCGTPCRRGSGAARTWTSLTSSTTATFRTASCLEASASSPVSSTLPSPHPSLPPSPFSQYFLRTHITSYALHCSHIHNSRLSGDLSQLSLHHIALSQPHFPSLTPSLLPSLPSSHPPSLPPSLLMTHTSMAYMY